MPQRRLSLSTHFLSVTDSNGFKRFQTESCHSQQGTRTMQERYRYGLVAQHRRGKTAQSTRQMHSEDDFHEFKFGTQSTRQMHSEDDFHEFKFGTQRTS